MVELETVWYVVLVSKCSFVPLRIGHFVSTRGIKAITWKSGSTIRSLKHQQMFFGCVECPNFKSQMEGKLSVQLQKTHMAVLKIRSKLEQPESFLGKPRNYMIPYCWLYIHYVPLICWKKISPIFGHNVSLTFGGFAWSVPFLPFSATYPHKSSTWVCLKMEKKGPGIAIWTREHELYART